MIRGVECAKLQERLMVEIDRKGSTRKTIAAIYREAIIVASYDGIDWPRVNNAILQRYKPSGLDRIKAWAWGYK